MRRHFKAHTTGGPHLRLYPYALCGIEARLTRLETLVAHWTDTPADVTCKRCQAMLRKRGYICLEEDFDTLVD